MTSGAASDLSDLSPGHIVQQLGRAAKDASAHLSRASTDNINQALNEIAASLRTNITPIIEANNQDITAGEAKGLNEAMLDRLRLTPERIEAMATGVETVRDLDDPTGKSLWQTQRPNGLDIQRVSVPIGVLGMIYESRPNVTIDAAALCLKSHNAVILRGGSEGLNSSLEIYTLIQSALKNVNLPEAAVSMIPTSDREAVGAMLADDAHIDVMIPRGGKGLIERVMNEARMPVFSHLDGICHIYIHPSAKPEIATEVSLNAKMRRTGICGAMETLLLDSALDQNVAKHVVKNLLDNGCALVGDKLAQNLDERIEPATAQDWHTEYLDAKLSVCVVNGVEEATTHINAHGSHHTDSILAEDTDATAFFLHNVNSGIVMHNASTQFADGGEFGMGAEIGIATGKMHARGPVGLEQLCTYKYIVRGAGQTRA